MDSGVTGGCHRTAAASRPGPVLKASGGSVRMLDSPSTFAFPECLCRVRSTIIFPSRHPGPISAIRRSATSSQPYGLKVNHKPVVLVDLFSETGGLPLIKRHPVRQRYRMVELQRWRDKRGLNFHFQPKHVPLNARLADGVVIAAVQAGHDRIRFCVASFRRSGRISSIWLIPPPSQSSPMKPAFPARGWSSVPLPGRSARRMSKTARTRSRPTCSARRSMCSMARFSGARTGSNCSLTH